MGIWASFCNFLEKSYFNIIGLHFACAVQSHLKELDFEHFKANN